MPGMPSCRSMSGLLPPLVRWSHGIMVAWPHGIMVPWSPRLMVGCLDGRRDIDGILRSCLCEAFLPAIFHWIYMPVSGFSPPVCAAITVNSPPPFYQCWFRPHFPLLGTTFWARLTVPSNH